MSSIGDLSQSLRRTRSARVTSASSNRFHTPSSSTPRIQEAPPTFSQPRSGATPTRTTRPAIPPPQKPKFSMEEQIKILERMKTGDYNKSMGLGQFQIERDLTGQVQAKSKSKKKGAEQKQKEPSKKKSVGKRGPSLPPLMSPSQELPDFAELMGGPEKDYASVPDYIKQFDSLLISQITCFKTLYKNAVLCSEIYFAKVLKPKVLVSLHRQMARVTSIIQKFLRLSPWDRAQVFNPGKSKKVKEGNQQRPYLHCRVGDQKNVAETILKATRVLDKLHHILVERKAEDFDAKMKAFQKLADGLEEKLKRMNAQSIKCNDILKREEELENEEDEDDDGEDDEDDNDSSESDSDTSTSDSDDQYEEEENNDDDLV